MAKNWTDENDWNVLVENFNRQYRAWANCTDVDPINNNGHTDEAHRPTEKFIEVNKFSKKNALVAMLNELNDCQGTIVFVEQKRLADFIAILLCELNYPTTSIHEDREQPERETALRDFNTKKMKVLVATAVAVRGLDITGVTTVVNFDLPKTIEEYQLRIGLLGNLGRAVSFIDPANNYAPWLRI